MATLREITGMEHDMWLYYTNGKLVASPILQKETLSLYFSCTPYTNIIDYSPQQRAVAASVCRCVEQERQMGNTAQQIIETT